MPVPHRWDVTVPSQEASTKLEPEPLDPRVRAYVELLKQNLAEAHGLALEELRRSVNLSASRLRHLFRGELGVSPARYLHDLRMREARRLLQTTFLSVKEIAWRVGMPTSSHFTRRFSVAFGLSPTRYRRYVRVESRSPGDHLAASLGATSE
jgi:transcriptional regulator GlxA family with amidase domain